MNQYEPPSKAINIEASPKKKKYRLNKKKAFLFIAVLCFSVAAVIIGTRLFKQHFFDVLAQNSDTPAVNNVAAATVEQSQGIENENEVLEGRLIVVDAGHGGFDPGAIGCSGAEEDELNLSVAQYLKKDLESEGAKVIMTRSDGEALAESKEEDMAERRRIITESGSDIVVSIHMNSFTDSSVSGPLVLFMEGSTKGEKLAKCIQSRLLDAADPVMKNDARSGDLYILRSGWQPCVLVECGYLSNPDDEKMLADSDYQKKLAAAICGGIESYFSDANE